MNRPDESAVPLGEPWPATLRHETVSTTADGVVDTEARGRCPWCSAPVSLGLDPGSGPEQVYAEDCPVCCRAWSVSVRYGPTGRARVRLEREDDA